MRRSGCLFFFILIAMVLDMTGCAHFHPNPLSPSQTAASFEARTLDDPGLKRFLETNLHHELTPWPPVSWDFERLTLVAFYDHPDLDVARAQWGVAQAGVITAGGRPNPNVGLTPQYNAAAANGLSPWTLGFNLDIPIETAGKRGYRISQAKHLSEAARLNIASVAWAVRSRLRTALLDFYAADQTEALLIDQRILQEEIVTVLEQRLAVGEASQPDVTEAHLALDRVRLAWHTARQRRTEARARLAEAVGMGVGALNGIQISWDALDHLPSPADVSLEELRRQALLNRPDILGALADYAASQSALQLEVARQYPDIHLGPGYSWDQGDNKWSLGVSVSLPVLNQNQGPIAEAEARRAETQARFTALQARFIGEMDRTLAGYHAAFQTLETADALLSAKKTQLESTQTMFDIGEADRIALLGAQFERDTITLSRVDVLVKAQQALGLLEDALQRPMNATELFPVPEGNPRETEEIQK